MTYQEIADHFRAQALSSVTRLVEDIQHIPDTGLSQRLVKRIWLYYVLKELSQMEEFSNIPLTVSLSQILDLVEAGNG